MSGNALLERWPGLARHLPWIPLGTYPSAYQPAPDFGAAIGAQTWFKRDDLAGPAYGGNKVRKLEFLLADAKARGCDAVLTYGAAGSNHALATAVYARALGLHCYAVLTDQPDTPYVANTLRYLVHLGVDLLPCPDFFASERVAAAARAAHPTGPEKVCEITWGGSTWLGTAGFVAGGLELAAQVAAGVGPAPDRLYLACGTMGSAAGLALGLRLGGLEQTTVVAVKVVPRAKLTRELLGEFLAETNRELHAREPALPLLPDPARNIECRNEFLGPGYALPTPECLEAIELAARLAGCKVDLTYSAKALACLVADARGGALAGRTAGFWLTYNGRPYPAALGAVPAGAIPESFRKFLPAGGG